ncbi:4-hydroxy-tetrahydrodipicolinate synthase [Azospirillum halopraeferens]|uniref:4-hydroxy-tetrahydrodipicolinate synthase n=1 Tax=Azospirillum halopraeferens TaxID=34010 RepID=UPI00040515A2|nr:4-hydroxy-tetrahydrodipicolinate synthase [Azospirillum halopraeferens]
MPSAAFDRTRLAGVFTALVTPLRDGAVDGAAFDRLLDRQLAAGVAGVVPLGTTGEAATLDDGESRDILRRTVARCAGRAFVLAGAGANDTAKAVAAARRAADLGADGLLVVTPYYNKPGQSGLYAHYAAVAAATPLPVVLYSVPGRCGVEIAPETAGRLARDLPTVVGIKEAGGRAERVTQLRRVCGPDFVIHCGDDALTLPFLALGAVGVTSVLSNVVPAEVVAMVAAARAGDGAAARAAHDRLFGLTETLFLEGNPVPVKAALAALGLMDDGVRLPLAAAGEETRVRLRTELEGLGLTGVGAASYKKDHRSAADSCIAPFP